MDAGGEHQDVPRGHPVRRRIVRRDLGRLDVPDPTQDPNACDISSLQAAPDGSLWVSMHDTEDHELGSEVGVPSRQAVRLDEANGVVKGPKGWTLVKLVKIGDLPDMVGSMDAMVKSRQVKHDGTSESAAKAADGEVVEVEADGAEDARTVAVEYRMIRASAFDHGAMPPANARNTATRTGLMMGHRRRSIL